MRYFQLIACSLLVSQNLCAEDITVQNATAQIDQMISARWQTENVQPAQQSDDAEFCRRIWLDLAGVAPPVSAIRSFLKDSSDKKREKLIQQILNSPEHANHMASVWTKILVPSTTNDGRQNTAALTKWLRSKFNRNLPYDYLVAGFLTAGGSGDTGPTVFYTSNDLDPKKLAAATSRIFMGIQLQCAECHDHPFDRWTQEDFWSYAAFFSQLARSNNGNNGEAIIEDRLGGEVMLPDTDQTMAPKYPGIDEVPEADPGNRRRRQLTIWMASRDNPYLARAAVNRVWGQLMGRGFVDPVDAMDANNVPSHPELLDALAKFLVQQRFDLRKLYAAIVASKTYQLSSKYTGERPNEELFAVQNVKTLSADQIYLTLQQNIVRQTSNTNAFSRQQFLLRMESSETSSLEYPHGVVQVLGMMNGPEILQASRSDTGLLASLEAPFFDDATRIETLYLATVSRKPTETERNRCAKFISQGETVADRRAAISDTLWALLNTAEFAVCP